MPSPPGKKVPLLRNSFTGVHQSQIVTGNMQEYAGRKTSGNSFEELVKTISIKSGDAVMIFFFLVNGFTAAGLSVAVILKIGLCILGAFAVLIALSTYIALREEQKVFAGLDNEEFLRQETERERRLLDNLDIPASYQSLAQVEIDKDFRLWKNLRNQLQKDHQQTTGNTLTSQVVYATLAFLLGGFLPFLGYLVGATPEISLQISSLISLVSLFILGFGKSFYLRTPLIMGAFTELVGGGISGIAGYIAGHFFIPLFG